MNPDDLKQRLYDLLEDYDKVIPMWAEAKAQFEKMKALKEVTLAVIASSYPEGDSEASRSRKALKSSKYALYGESMKDIAQEYYNLDARKEGIAKRIDVFRSLLSFEKSMVEKLT